MMDYSKYTSALIVVDMVNGFVREGVLHDKGIERIVPNVVELVKRNLDDKNLIIFIKDTHHDNSVEFNRFGNTKHCVKGTSEAELIDELKIYEDLDNVVSVEKNSTSFMESPKFRELISQLENLKEVDIVGCCTDICDFNGCMGLSNYFNEWNKDILIKVYSDACATYNEDERKEYVDAAYLLMEQQGINIVGMDVYGK